MESPGKDCELVRRLDAKGGRQLRRRSPQAQKMSRYPSAYGHTPTYRSVGSTVYPSALGRDPLDVPVFENTKTSVYTQCVATLKAMLVLNIWFSNSHTQMYAPILALLRRASLLDSGPVPPSTESLIGLLRKTSLAISTLTSPSAPALAPALPCPTWSTTSSSPQGGAPLSPQPPATLAPHPRTRQRSTAPV